MAALPSQQPVWPYLNCAKELEKKKKENVLHKKQSIFLLSADKGLFHAIC